MGNSLNCFNKQLKPEVDEVKGVDEVLLSELRNLALSDLSDPSDLGMSEDTDIEQIPGSVGVSENTDIEQIPGSAPTVGEVIDSFKAVSDTTDLNEFIHIIKQLLEEKKSDKGSTSESKKENRGIWISFITSGAKFLKLVNDHTQKIKDKKDILCFGKNNVVAEILDEIGEIHWVAGGLVTAAYVIEKIDKTSAHKAEALHLLTIIVDLVETIIKLKDEMPMDVMPQEKLKNVVMLLLEGSIMCASELQSEDFFSFLKSSIDSENLKEMSKKLQVLYDELNLLITTFIAKRKSEMSEQEMEQHQSEIAILPKPCYPKDAVGIKDAQEEVIELLNMRTEDESTLVVVIYGVGGIGKTTLANSVVATLNLDGYNYAMVQLNEDMFKNNLKEMQELVLKYAFPSFHSQAIKLRDCEEGRDRLTEACRCVDNKPVFLFIDDVLRSEDLKDLLPEDLSDLPKRSRIFITTRRLDATDVFLVSGFMRRPFAMKTLDNHHAEKILCKYLGNLEGIKYDMEGILRICGGVPLAIRIVGGDLSKMGYYSSNWRRILNVLEKGAEVKEDQLSRRLIDFVYNELEDSTKDAFLDICWFFNGWIRRHVEYIVGASEVNLLEEASLVTQFEDNSGGIYSGEKRLTVHNILRARGQSMSASTRFMDVESFSQAAQDETRLEGIKGLWFADSGSEYLLQAKHLNSMRHSLRIMSLGRNVITNVQSRMKFEELRYLMVGEDFPHLPMKVEEPEETKATAIFETEIEIWKDTLKLEEPENVPHPLMKRKQVEEDVPHLQMKKLEQPEDVPQLPMKLDNLDMLGIFQGPMLSKKVPKRLSMIRSISSSQFDTFASSGFQNHYLQELHLRGCKIQQLPEGLHQLYSLKILSLDEYDEIEEFPEQVCQLFSLIRLRIFGWYNLKRLPQSFARLKGLTHLEITRCSELEELPSSFGQLTSLEHLNLSCCPKLKHLPGGLKSLKYLNVSGCEHLSLKLYRRKIDLKIVNFQDAAYLSSDVASLSSDEDIPR